ncbi:MAG: inorganic diphosphatase [Patescibacteria group bacterium]|nr:inorganic diphosphatase [Patescibacteria group bacterium]MCL5262002.1 inorganic diphosphatase [Patescibacteria group bacterium]
MKAIIEIPKGDDRRRHFKFDKTGFIDLGPTKDIIPINDGVMPIHYGFIPETLNEKEGDEIDILVLSDRESTVGEEICVKPIALIRRADGDDKVVAVDVSREDIREWKDIPETERKLIEDFFSYHHRFLSVEKEEFAEQYVENGRKGFIQSQK